MILVTFSVLFQTLRFLDKIE